MGEAEEEGEEEDDDDEEGAERRRRVCTLREGVWEGSGGMVRIVGASCGALLVSSSDISRDLGV